MSQLRDAYVEMVCTRGLPKPGSRDPRDCTNQFFAFAIPFVWIANPEKQKEGLHLIVSRLQRIPPDSVDPTVKNYHWLDLVMGLFEAYDRGGETVILVDGRGNLVEGPGFNFFMVNGHAISTPGRGVLEGITRRTAIELATKYGYQVVERDIPAAEARTAGEIFISSTAGGIMPIKKIDEQTIGSGGIGPVTKKLHRAYWMLHEDPQYNTKVDY
jgi:branched-chain amino acid aminotransferase